MIKKIITLAGGEKGVSFVHHNGFLAKTQSKDWEEAKILVKKSICKKIMGF